MANRYPALREGGNIDVVHSHRHAGNELEVGCGIEQGAVDSIGQEADQPLAACKLRAQAGGWQQARADGAAAFKVHCSQCHGTGAAGSQQLGYPNLNDDDWLWGGDMAAIEYAITHGIRQPGEFQRQGAMPPFAGVLDPAQLAALAQHVRSLSGLDRHDGQGAEIFATNCASCHGDTGQGMRSIGAPNLRDAIWLRGSSAEAITAQVLGPKMGVMPAWGERLDPATIKMLTIYVHSLGGGEKSVPEETVATDPLSEADGQQ